jgi:cellulose-binding protein
MRATVARVAWLAAAGLAAVAVTDTEGRGAEPPARASQVDPYVARPRVIVMTDIANEPDDQMSLIRFLLYSNQFDVEGLVATTSTWMKTRVRPDVIHAVLDAYEKVHPNLLKHAAGFPTAAALRGVVVTGQPAYGMEAVGPDKTSPGAALIVRAAMKADARPLWVLGWGGANTLAQALVQARATRTPAELEAIVARLRVYTISDQDDAGPWIRREFPALHYVATPSTPDGEQYYFATWTGISGDRFYRNAPGADFTTFSDEWVNANVRGKGPLGALYPFPCCIHEGDTPSFLGLIDNGLASAMSPAFGGWGGRYVWRQPAGETRAFWTQGGDSYPGRDSSRDTVVGADGRTYTSDQATIWRWRTAFQHDFAARMDWTIKDVAEANHNPRIVVNGRAGTDPLELEAQVGTPVILDAAGTADPDGHALTYTWFFYPEAGTGIPGRPVFVRGRPPTAGGAAAQGGIPPAPAGGPPEPALRVVVENAHGSRATVVPGTPGIAHVILAVEDDGKPGLTSYRRVILETK